MVRKPTVGTITPIRAFTDHDGFGRIGDSHSKPCRIPRYVMADMGLLRKVRYVAKRLSARAGKNTEAENSASPKGLRSRDRNLDRLMVIVA
jgi:hypothetical protein